jgi:hypothetical protein
LSDRVAIILGDLLYNATTSTSNYLIVYSIQARVLPTAINGVQITPLAHYTYGTSIGLSSSFVLTVAEPVITVLVTSSEVLNTITYQVIKCNFYNLIYF